MSRGISKAELSSILATCPRLVGPLRGMVMAGFLSKAELATLVAGSVGTTDLANGAVTTAKLADGAVTAAKVHADYKDGSAATPSLRTLGNGATQAAAGNHTHT